MIHDTLALLSQFADTLNVVIETLSIIEVNTGLRRLLAITCCK